MSSNVFEKILKIVQVALALIEMAVRAFTGQDVEPTKDV